MQVDQVVNLKHMLHDHVQETTFGDEKDEYCRLKLMVQRDLEHEIEDSHIKARNGDEDRPAIGAPRKRKQRKDKANNMQHITLREDTVYVGLRKATVHLEICAHSSVNQTGKAKGKDGLVHPLRVRGVFSAKGPDSSVGGVGGVPVVFCPDDGHMEEEVQLKVQAEEEEEIGETHGKEQGEERKSQGTDNTQAHYMDDYAVEMTRTDTFLSHAV